MSPGWRYSLAEELRRMKCGSVTEALIAATESADKMSHVLIIWEGVGDDPGGCTSDDGMDVKTANYLTDQLKNWLFRHVKEFE